MSGDDPQTVSTRRTWLDWVLVLGSTAVIVAFAAIARVPALAIDWGWAAVLTVALAGFLAVGGVSLWRATRLG